MLVFEIFWFCHTPVTQCLCVLDPVPELSQSEPITDGQWSSQGALASDQHDVPSHPHTDPGDITTLAVQVAQHLNEDMNDVFQNFVHCEPRYERSFDQT